VINFMQSVPSDNVELLILKKLNTGVPVIAVLTKYEALINRVKNESTTQVAKRLEKYAIENVFNPLRNMNVLAAIVKTHRMLFVGIILILLIL